MKKIIFYILVFTGLWFSYFELKESLEKPYDEEVLDPNNLGEEPDDSIDIEGVYWPGKGIIIEYGDSIIKDEIELEMECGDSLLSAIMFIESSYNDSAYRADEDAVGCLQIRKTMVNDINRILKRRKSTLRFTYHDRWDRNKSIQMFEIYCDHYNLTTAEEIARCWNGGPRGINNPATVGYWKKVKDKINS